MTIRRAGAGPDASAFWFAVRLGVFGVGLAALWGALNTVLLPARVEALAPAALRGTAVGLVGLLGIGLGALAQPVAGRLSDRAPRRDRRRPFIAGGTGLGLVGLLGFGLAADLPALAAAYVLMQLAANVAQAAFQALIPDLVAPAARGLAAGVKSALGAAGAALGLLGTGLLVGAGGGAAAPLAFLGLVLAAAAALTYAGVPPAPPPPAARRAAGGVGLPSAAGSWRAAVRAAVRAFRARPAFARAVAAQFLLLLGAYPLQRFLVLYVEDRHGVDGAGRLVAGVVLAAVLLGVAAAVAAGALSDRVGRLPLLRGSAGLTALGLLGVALAPAVGAAAAAGMAVGLGTGAFLAVNWARLGDEIPAGGGALYYGLANLATAGAGALAGLYGPLADLLRPALAGGAYPAAFALAALVASTSLLPLRGAAGPAAPP